MSENFKIEIITPDKTLISTDTSEVVIPSYEGLMTILKEHIPLVTFLRPGIIVVNSNNSIEKFFVEEGTVEFSENNLLILTTLAINIKNLSSEEINKKIESTKIDISKTGNNDKINYILSHKLDALKEIN
jgi:F-type H+-transporting ATPase subunit epsilon